MRRSILLILAGLIWLANSSQAVTNDAFAQGLVAARAGDFSTASEDFQKSISQKPSSGALVNLGISEWRSGHAGLAILAWEQAQWIDPFEKNARNNLNFARLAAQVDEPQLKWWFEKVSTWLPPPTGGSGWPGRDSDRDRAPGAAGRFLRQAQDGLAAMAGGVWDSVFSCLASRLISVWSAG